MQQAQADAYRWQLEQGMAELGLVADASVADRLLAFLALLERWNRAYNLTAVRNPKVMVSRHLLDSLAVLPFLKGSRVADIGTGAGLPGIPLALASPECRFVLLDSNGKKTRFVSQAVLELGLDNVEVVRARVEDYRPEEGFDTVVCRAFAEVAGFLATAGHLLQPGARALLMKGAYPHGELAGLPAGVALRTVHPLNVPGLDAERHLVELIAVPEDSAGH